MAKPHITRTYGQIHFEDLDPKRFEDLVRELIYDFKDWQNIEATGRSGNDGGFDIRAFEKKLGTTIVENEEGEETETSRTLEGNLWMIQGKREKVIGPTRIKKILADVNKKNPPYGYILAASANFSKDSYDIFRSELQKKGVMEFHLWGKAELEDMLHQPKNDRILFTFFGISLVSRRRSRSTEIRAVVINKNKLLTTLGEEPSSHSVLVRDSNDTKYPYKQECRDFDKNPRWKEYGVSEYHPLGLVLSMHKHYAYVDHVKKEFDFSKIVSLIYGHSDKEDDRERQRQLQDKVEDYWHHLPKINQAHFYRNGLLRFDDMLVIDAKGDNWHKFPHIFVDFEVAGPFAGYFEYLENSKQHTYLRGYKRIEVFPKTFPRVKRGKLHKDKELVLEKHFQYRLRSGSADFDTLYETDGRFNFLKVRDAYPVADPQDSSRKNYVAITRIETSKYKDYVSRNPGREWGVQEHLGRTPDPEEIINIYEFKPTYDFLYEPKKPLRLPKPPSSQNPRVRY